MTWKGLRYKGVEPVFPHEWNLLIDALDQLHIYVEKHEEAIKEIDPAKLGDIYQVLLRLEERKQVKTLGYEILKYVYADTDVFDMDLIAQIDGKIRSKLLADRDVLVRLCFRPRETLDLLMAYLNAGVPITGDCWFEFDFTVRKEDRVNIRILPDSKVTVFIFNIGET